MSALFSSLNFQISRLEKKVFLIEQFEPQSHMHNWLTLRLRPGAYSIKLYGSVNYGFVVTAKF